MRKLLLILLMLPILGPTTQAQTPSLVNAVSGSNSLSAVSGAKEGSGCATNSYCAHLADPSLAGNTIVVFTTYDDSPATSLTVSDNKGNSYTAGPAAHDTVNGRWVASFYANNVMAGTLNVTVTWSASLAHLSVMTEQWMNTGALDASSGSAVANSSTLVSAGNLTPTASGDLLVQYGCRAQNISATGYTAGSQTNITWALLDGSADVRHGCVAQWGIYNSTAALNPAMSWAAGSGGATIAIAFKAVSSGAAASGMHIVAAEHFSSPNNTTGPFSLHLPSSSTNNLIVFSEVGGGNGPMQVSSITDSNGNTWSSTGAPNFCAASSSCTSTWYAANATLSPTMTITINTTNTGDIGGLFYIIAGANAAPFLNRATAGGGQSGAGNLNMLSITPAGASGIVFSNIGVNFNTVGGLASPSGSVFDSESYGGENISGPISVDENNGWGHYYFSSSAAQTWTWTFWDPSIAAGGWGGEANAFAGSSGSATLQPPTGLKATVQ